ncbi:MAG: glycosyltransferase family 1 protein [Salinivirgaceae bacterium]
MSEPIRVLQVLAGMNRGGSESFVMNLYRNIDRTKVQFDFILYRKEECDFNEEIRQMGGRIFWVPRYTGKNHFLFKKAWNRFFKQHKEYKIIHGHVRSAASIYLSIARKYGLITIAHSHSTSSRGNILEKIGKKLLQYTIRFKADYLFACSNEAGKWLYGSKRDFLVINNAIDIQKFVFDENTRQSKRNELGLEGKFVIGHIGTFTKPKNHNFLIDIFKEVFEKNNKAILLLIGRGELQVEIQKKVKELGLFENVIFAGVRSDISELLQAMDVFVFPSLFEGIPVTLIESQASGIFSILSSNISDEVKVTDSVEFISLSKSPQYWADKLLKIGEIDYRVVNSQRLKDGGYDIHEVTNIIMKFYKDIINM